MVSRRKGSVVAKCGVERPASATLLRDFLSLSATSCETAHHRSYEVGQLVELHVAQWERGGALDRLQCETGADVSKVDGIDESLVDRIICSDIWHLDAEQVVHLAAHTVDLGDFRHITRGRDKPVEPGLIVFGRPDHNEYCGAHIEGLRV